MKPLDGGKLFCSSSILNPVVHIGVSKIEAVDLLVSLHLMEASNVLLEVGVRTILDMISKRHVYTSGTSLSRLSKI